MDWAQIASNLFNGGGGSSRDSGASRRLFDQLSQWVGLVAKNAALKWTSSLLGDVYACGFCDADALTRCSVCGVDVCLAHGAVRHSAEVICDECIQIAVDARKTPRRRRRASRKPPPPPAGQQDPISEAYAILGLAPGADISTVEAVFRRKAATDHPDRGGDPERFSQLSAAYSLLKQHLGGS